MAFRVKGEFLVYLEVMLRVHGLGLLSSWFQCDRAAWYLKFICLVRGVDPT